MKCSLIWAKIGSEVFIAHRAKKRLARFLFGRNAITFSKVFVLSFHHTPAVL